MILGHIYSLPSGATKHSVELGLFGELSIHSFFKGRDQEIKISKYRVKNYTLKVKDHMFKLKITSTGAWCEPPHIPACHCVECCGKKHDKLDFHLYSDFMPYMLYNVDSSAHICFGNDLTKYPKNLKQANAAFWSAPFNTDLGPYSFREPGAHKCNPSTKKHKSKTHPPHTSWDRACRREFKHSCTCEFKDFSDHNPGCPCLSNYCGCKCSCACCLNTCSCICRCKCCLNLPDCGCLCDCIEDEVFWVMQNMSGPKGYPEIPNPILETDQAHGLFVSQNSQILARVDESFHKKCRKGGCVIGFCIKVEDSWYIDISGKEEDILKLTSEEIRVA